MLSTVLFIVIGVDFYRIRSSSDALPIWFIRIGSTPFWFQYDDIYHPVKSFPITDCFVSSSSNVFVSSFVAFFSHVRFDSIESNTNSRPIGTSFKYCICVLDHDRSRQSSSLLLYWLSVPPFFWTALSSSLIYASVVLHFDVRIRSISFRCFWQHNQVG